jgi:hypothetical protein
VTYARRTDENQRIIVAALRAAGASVEPTYNQGRGVPDIVAGFRGVNYWLEIKTDSGKLTGDEVRWHNEWRGQVAIVRSVEDALREIGAT